MYDLYKSEIEKHINDNYFDVNCLCFLLIKMLK